MQKIKVNGTTYDVDVPEDTPLLWVIREELGLTGTKFGCGKGICGACTVHVSGQPTRTCILPVMAAQGQDIRTIEDIGTPEQPHIVQKNWTEHSVPQCGYCQSGQLMQAIGWLESKNKMSEDEIFSGIASNLCRCGSYNKIREAVLAAARDMGKLKEGKQNG